MKKNIFILYVVLCLEIIFIVGCGSGDEQPTYGTQDNDRPNANTFASQDLKQRQKAQTEGIDLKAGKRISDKASLTISSSDLDWDKPKKYHTMLFDTNEYEEFPASFNGEDEHVMYAFHTEQEDNPWCIVDLKKAYSISQVKIWNREDLPERVVNPVVSFSTDKKKWTEIARGEDAFHIWIIDGKNTKARYIKFQCMNHDLLHLYKLHVYGKK